MLKNEVTQLKQLLLTHKDCPITAMQKESQGYLSEYYHAPTWPGVTLHNNGCVLFVGYTHWYRYLWQFLNVWRLPLPGYRGGDNSLIFSVTEELVVLVVFMMQEIEILFPFSLWSTVKAFSKCLSKLPNSSIIQMFIYSSKCGVYCLYIIVQSSHRKEKN